MRRVAPPLSIALLGTRGIPASYGGFETFAEELSVRLVQRGHTVTVFGRKSFFGGDSGRSDEGSYRGVRTLDTPTIFHKYLETPVHALTSFLRVGRREYDVALVCNAANSPFAWILKARGMPVVVNVDGIERRRTKWNTFGRLWYRLGELASVRLADRIVSDANVIADYYRERYAVESEVIAYGANPVFRLPGPVLEEFGLAPRNFILYVSRLEPENNALGVIRAYVKSGLEMPLVIVGDAPYADEYKAALRAAANSRVVFTGFRFGDAYRELRSHCLLAVQATEVGGTHPALVESMAYGNCVIANDVPEHREVLEDAGAYYRFNDFDHLAELMRELATNAEIRGAFSSRAAERAREIYAWDAITDAYEGLLLTLAGRQVAESDAPRLAGNE